MTGPHDGWSRVSDRDELRRLLGRPTPRNADKVRRRLHELDRAWLSRSPFCLVATSAADGSCDVSPKGDPPGFVVALDDTTVALPERKGNRRADGFLNLLGNPHVALLSLIPGRADTLRINGRAEIVSDAPFMDAMAIAGRRPVLALVVHLHEVFFHCSKAPLRARLWAAETWAPASAPSRAVISKTLEKPEASLAELERYYGPDYARNLY